MLHFICLHDAFVLNNVNINRRNSAAGSLGYYRTGGAKFSYSKHFLRVKFGQLSILSLLLAMLLHIAIIAIG